MFKRNFSTKILLILIYLIIFLVFFSFDNQHNYNLQGLIDYALANNSEIEQLDLNIKKAEFDLSIAKAKKYPSISLSVSLSYLTNPIGPISITAGQFGSISTSNGDILIPPEDMIIYQGMENTLYQFKITIDQPIFTWGKIDNAIEVYKLLVEVEKLKKIEKIDEIKTKIKIYYHSLYYLEKILQTLNLQREIVERIVNISKQSYENGFITYSDYLQAIVSQKEFEFNFTRVEGERKKAINDLKAILNFPLEKELKIDYSEFEEKLREQKVIFYNIPENLWQFALENNLQLKQLEIFKKVVEKQFEIINASSYLKPDIGLRIEVSYYGPRFPLIETGWFTQDDYNITISLGISTPIFDAGSLEAKIKQAKNEIAKILMQIDYAYQNISNLLESIKLKCEINKAKIDYYLSKIEADKEIIQTKQNAFEEGEIDEIEYLKIKSTMYTDTISLYIESIDYYTNYFSLEVISGLQF
ncbi:MAG: TolC family protein [Spirochaetales bacterium]|nr:TolC family protein [Spirochaetales bacterium]